MAHSPSPATLRSGKYITLEQAADQTQLSARTLRRRIAEGKLPAYRLGRVIRLLPADVDAMFTPTTQWTGGAA